MMIHLLHAAFVYQAPDGEVEALRDVSLDVEEGEFCSIVGPSGCGKSTLLSVLAGLETLTGGEVTVDGEALRGPSPKVGFMPQQDQLFPWRSIWDNVTLALAVRGENTPENQARVRSLLERYGLWAFREKRPGQLSGGMRQRCALIRTLAADPRILLLDEPTAGMDALSRRQMWNLLRKLNEKNLTILLTTHYMEEAQNLCNRVALMDHGKLEEVSTPQALIESLGAYAVDEMTADGTQNHYFHTRQEAIRYLEELTGQASLRETTLEDVFVERAGKHLISK